MRGIIGLFAHAKENRCNAQYDMAALPLASYVSNRRMVGLQEPEMAKRSSGRGFFRNALNAIVAARTAQAERYVSYALLMMDDDALKAGGYTRQQLRHKRSSYFYL
jgi:hypothetical protein